MKFMEILVRQGGSQGASQGGSSSARSFDLARRGVVPPLESNLLQVFVTVLSTSLFSVVSVRNCTK